MSNTWNDFRTMASNEPLDKTAEVGQSVLTNDQPQSSIALANSICEDIAQVQDYRITTSGLHRIKSVNQTMLDASKEPDPVHLYDELVIEGEVTMCFAASNVGKTVFAVQIAEEISKQQPVIYFDYELSDKQFQLRYTDEDNGDLHIFPEKFMRATRSSDSYRNGDVFSVEKIIEDIEQLSTEYDCKVFFLDNLGTLCNKADDGEEAGKLMEQLLKLKIDKGFTIFVVSHPRKMGRPHQATMDDAYGSSKICNNCDAVIFIGQSCKDTNTKYVKQLKARGGRKEYVENNVLLYNLSKTGCNMCFEYTGNGEEWEHLPSKDEFMERSEKAQKKEQAKTMKAAGKTIDQIAIELGVPRTTIGNWVKGIEKIM